MNKKTKRPKCRRCHTPLKRKSESFYKDKPYKGNMICYGKKEYQWDNGKNTRYRYILWDGESYKLWLGKEFCGTKCASMWAYDRN
jgi:hypothetical protein